MKECIQCNFNLVDEDEDYCQGCINQNKKLERINILRLKKEVPKIIKEIYMKKYLENVNLINQFEVLEVEN